MGGGGRFLRQKFYPHIGKYVAYIFPSISRRGFGPFSATSRRRGALSPLTPWGRMGVGRGFKGGRKVITTGVKLHSRRFRMQIERRDHPPPTPSRCRSQILAFSVMAAEHFFIGAFGRLTQVSLSLSLR